MQTAVEKQELPPLDGARVISSITATLFGYDEFILREVSAESLLATTPLRERWMNAGGVSAARARSVG